MSIDANVGQMIYNSPAWSVSGSDVVQGNQSSIGEQIRLDVYIRKAIEEAAQEQYFSQLSSTMAMPKHMGKTIKKNYYIPLLDDDNVSTQGIDSDGTTDTSEGSGALYKGSKDIGTITGKIPSLTEYGGRVNRVGFTRKVIEATVSKFGFFYDFTQESLDFDSDAELLQHMSREAIKGANEITEDQLGIDLINNAGVVKYTGDATSVDTMTSEDSTCVATYDDIQKLAITLKENRAPNKLKAIRGSRIIDTKIVGTGFVMYIGYPLENQIRNMTNTSGEAVFIPVEKYAQGGNTLRGEIGAIGQFRFVVVPEMPENLATGALDTDEDEAIYRTSTNDSDEVRFDVFPMLAVASEAFTTVGFQTSKAGPKFKMITKMPGADTADRTDPYGESGFTSIKWYYGILIERPEWIAVMWSLAEA